MTITFPRSLPPEMVMEQVSMRARSVVAVTESPFTGEQQVQAHQGQLWEADVRLAQTERADAAVIQGWLVSLNGRENTFLFGDPAAATPRGGAASAPGAPTVASATVRQGTVDITAGASSVTNYLRIGDYIQIGSGDNANLHQVLENVSTDAAGAAQLTVWPNLRASHSAGATVVVASAVGRFRLAKNNVQWDERTILFGMTFQIVEAL